MVSLLSAATNQAQFQHCLYPRIKSHKLESFLFLNPVLSHLSVKIRVYPWLKVFSCLKTFLSHGWTLMNTDENLYPKNLCLWLKAKIQFFAFIRENPWPKIFSNLKTLLFHEEELWGRVFPCYIALGNRKNLEAYISPQKLNLDFTSCFSGYF